MPAGENSGADSFRDSAETHRELLEATGTGYVVIDTDGLVVDANAEYLRLTGRTSMTDILGKSVLEWTAPEEQEGNQQAVRHCVAHGLIRNLRVTYRHADGTRVPIELNATLVDAGGSKRILTLCRDISERIRVEQELFRSQDQYKNLVEDVNVGIFQTTLDGRAVHVNSAFVQILGYADMEEMKNLAVQSLYADPADRERFIARLNAEAHVSNFETRAVKKSGAFCWVSISAVLMRAGDSEPPAILGSLVDITDRKVAEEALKRSEEKFANTFKTSPDAINLTRLSDGVFYDINQSFTNITGYTREDVLGRSALKDDLGIWVDHRDRERLVASLREKGEALGLEIPLRCKDGRFIHCVMSARIMLIDGEPYILSVTRDMTARKRMEDALAAEKERLSVTLRSIADGVISTDNSGKVDNMNRVAEELTGWTIGEAAGRDLSSVLVLFRASTREPLNRPLAPTRGGKLDNWAEELILLARDGTERVISSSAAPILDNKGEMIGTVLVFRDMTENLKLIEAAQMAQKLESLGVLAGGIAHDFNNLLGGIYGNVELALEETSDKQVAEYLLAVTSSLSRATSLTQQLLTFAKGGSPIMRVARLFPFVRQAASFALSGSTVNANFSVAPDLRLCRYDENQLGQVIDNLVINALQAMPVGGVIDVEASNMTVGPGEHHTLTPGEYVRLSIADQGAGIPKDILPRIFDPFFTTKKKGSGLGLTTCYSIMRKHGGCIDAQNGREHGAVFSLYFPATSESEEERKRDAAKKHRGTGTVLVMDDDEVVRRALCAMLAWIGYKSVATRNGEEASAALREAQSRGTRFTALMLDLTVVGGMGGEKALEEIRKLDPSVPAFVVSGYADNHTIARPSEAGFAGSLRKPITLSDLAELFEGYFG